MTSKRKLIRKLRTTRSKNHKKYWGVLNRGGGYRTGGKPITFKGLLQVRDPNVTVAGRDDPEPPSGDTSI